MPAPATTVECPKCGTLESTVQNTKPTDDGGRVRRRVCLHCGETWCTFQAAEKTVAAYQVLWGTHSARFEAAV